MKDQSLARFEASLERLIEGAFAHMFSKSVRAQDIALQLARAMEMGAEVAHNGDPRPLAPDHYTIRMNPDVCQRLLKRQPALAQILSQHMVELATDAGYRLNTVPDIELLTDDSLGPGTIVVHPQHKNRLDHATAVMERIELPAPDAEQLPKNAQLIINGEQVIFLQEPVINIGRSRENHIVLDDAFVSRRHAQLRLRFGRYTLFDLQSQAGTYVNDVRIREHPLQTGDVIRMGKVQLVYLEDDPAGESQTSINLISDL
ncbi:MAG: DUF3662 and FHA domain-containing protein [Chloroflexota bacterium]|nr:MAG: hypothetical protein DIU68_04105 [Chloroflexota bacterium]